MHMCVWELNQIRPFSSVNHIYIYIYVYSRYINRNFIPTDIFVIDLELFFNS